MILLKIRSPGRQLLDMLNNTSADHAWESYDSLLDYYFDRPASNKSIRIGLKVGKVLPEAQTEELQKELMKALKTHEIIDSLTKKQANMRIAMKMMSFVAFIFRKHQSSQLLNMVSLGITNNIREFSPLASNYYYY